MYDSPRGNILYKLDSVANSWRIQLTVSMQANVVSVILDNNQLNW